MILGMFDSGVGGLTVLKKLCGVYPLKTVHYVADLMHAPYGTSCTHTIQTNAKRAIQFLKQKCDHIIIACHTVSTTCYNKLTEWSDPVPLTHMVQPTLRLIQHLKPASMVLLATTATIKTQQYQRQLKLMLPSMIMRTLACPNLVEAAEHGETHVTPILATYLNHQLPADVWLLGCTHFPLFLNDIMQHVTGHVIDPAQTLLNDLLSDYAVQPSNMLPHITCHVTAHVERFQQIAKKILPYAFTTCLVHF
jgi:glutamate racemase